MGSTGKTVEAGVKLMVKGRLGWFYGLLVIGVAILVGRLVILQIVDKNYYLGLAQDNRIEIVSLPADRGVIYDRNGEILVRNTPEGRDYIYGGVLAHVLGFVAEISEAELSQCQFEKECKYVQGDKVGKLGIEKAHDRTLRGVDGGVLVEKGADGEVVREIGRQEPQAGANLELTIDSQLQTQAYQLMEGKKGAVVVTDSDTGGVLALVSSPAFEPSQVSEYITDPDLPLFNRAIGGEYPPGSVFKLITATAGLEEGRIDESTEIEDTGEIKVGQFRYGNWYYDQYGKKEGFLRIVGALARSNDIFFYKVGEWLGATVLMDWAKYFGLGQITGIDIPGEANGLVPTPEWKQEFIGESWYLGDTYISAIGQGNVLMTPLQVNQMTAVMASGKQCRPHLVEAEPECQRLDISDKTIATVTEGLKQVAETGGTAWPFFEFKIKGERVYVAGKTGTAEFGDPDDKTHAWFTAFAPAKQPEMVLTVLLEAAGEGSNEAAPVAKELIEFWLGLKR